MRAAHPLSHIRTYQCQLVRELVWVDGVVVGVQHKGKGAEEGHEDCHDAVEELRGRAGVGPGALWRGRCLVQGRLGAGGALVHLLRKYDTHEGSCSSTARALLHTAEGTPSNTPSSARAGSLPHLRAGHALAGEGVEHEEDDG